MTLFTGKGDSGTTKVFNCDQRISKSSNIAEALGSLDEINSFLGLAKVQSAYLGYRLGDTLLSEIVHDLQKNLFVIQAELAGAEKTIPEKKVKWLEETINQIEKELPPVKSFFISGGPSDPDKGQLSGAGLGAVFDIARAIARRTERRVIAAAEEISQLQLPVSGPKENIKTAKISKYTKSYLNRLSSILYALARYSNHLAGIAEEAPDYR